MEAEIVIESDLVEGSVRNGRRWRTVAEKRRIVEQTLVPGASVAEVARTYRINANQIFQWRQQYRAGKLTASEANSAKLLPVVVSDDAVPELKQEPQKSGCGSIHIELPGRALVTIEAGVDPALAGAVIERLAR
jgi:transposase